MVRQLLKLMLCASALLMPIHGMAYSSMAIHEGSEETVTPIQLTVKGHQVRVQQAQGCTLEVYSVTGSKLFSVKIDSADQTIQLKLNRGCYIVKVGDVARKISLL